MEMERFVRQSILYDFYGELLTEHQKRIYEDIVFQDYSYTEVAEAEGISRQGVYDMIRRCDKILEEYESKLKLVEKFQNAKSMASEMQEKIEVVKKAYMNSLHSLGSTDSVRDSALLNDIQEIETLANKILQEF